MISLPGALLFISIGHLLIGDASACLVPSIRQKTNNETVVKVVNEGHEIKLTCQVRSASVVYWTKDNLTLFPGNHRRMKIRRNRHLKIKSTQEEDSGVYACVAKNGCGVNIFRMELFVNSSTRHAENKPAIAPPSFTSRSVKLQKNFIAVPVGNSLKLDCSAVGYPRPTVKWYKNGALFQHRNGRRLYLSPLTTVLSMRGVVPSDNGRYMCNVSNLYGWINHTYEVDIHERVRARPVIMPIENITVLEGNNATMSCKALSDAMPHFQWLRWFSSRLNGSGNSSSKTERPNYEVIKPGEQDSNQHLKLGSPGKFSFHSVKLTLVNVTKKDEGRYTCIVGNAVGYAVEQAFLTVSRLLAPPRFISRSVKLQKNFIAVPVGNSMKLDCSAVGYPRPTVKWYKNGALFQERKGKRLYLSPMKTVLSMKDVVPSDNGRYMCNVSNPYGWINHTYEVEIRERIRAKPVILPMENITVLEGNNATMLCKALSDSMPHFQWLRWFSSRLNGSGNSSKTESSNYEVIKPDEQDSNKQLKPKSHKKFDFHGVKLTLVNVTKKDEGRYTCIVGNAVGYNVEDAFLTVSRLSAPPRFTSRSVKLQKNLILMPVGNSMKLDCSAVGYPRPTVKWYKNGALFQERKGKRLYLSPMKTVLSMKDVVPSDNGRYMCNVSNPYGWINYTYEVEIRERIRAKPVILPMENITVLEGNNATMLCRALSDSMPHFQWLRWFSSRLNGSGNGSKTESSNYEAIEHDRQDPHQQLKPKGHKKFDFHGVKLTLVNVTKKDEGRYTCIVGNAVGYNVEDAFLTVSRLSAPPRFTSRSVKLQKNLILMPVGNSMKMDCSAVGYPRPTVKWYKNGALYQDRKDKRSHLSPMKTVLRLRDVVPSDNGRYMCNVSNPYGWINYTYEVEIIERMRARPVILPMENITVVEGENATMSCNALSDSMPHFMWLRWFSSRQNGSGNSSKTESLNYEVIKPEEQDSNQQLKPKSHKRFFHGVKLTLVNVTKKDEGRYTCSVGNAVGYNREHAFLTVSWLSGPTRHPKNKSARILRGQKSATE